MEKKEVEHLAKLARLKLTEEEVEKYTKEFGDILGYVEKIKEVSGDDSERIESAGVRNVFREDGEPQESGMYTDELLAEAPESKDGFVKVKKIL